MCGICGKYSERGVTAGEIEGMLTAIAHRGPDDQGMYLEDTLGLGSRRLSIIDLPQGRMPIANEDGALHIVYNGEIYNYRALRQTLLDKGHRFKTHSDTEVVVHLYEEEGERCVEHLRGMFAFAIWDKRERRLFLARDRLGQKPLFYAHYRGDFYFASEVKALLTLPQLPRELDLESLYHYLSLRFVPPPGTMFRHVHKLPPGHTLTFQNGRLRQRRYWTVSFIDKHAQSQAVLAAELKAHLKETVQAHLVSDVPVGAFLSGGLDSSTVVAMMAGENGALPVQTFAVGVRETSFNELPYARMVAEHCHTRHVETTAEANIIKRLPHMIWHLDEPSDPIAACMHQAAALAAQHVKVVLGGDGGDELFGGFDRYLGLGKIHHYRRLPAIFREQLIGRLITLMPENFAYKSVSQKLRWVHEVAALPDDATRYAEATFFFRFNRTGKQALFGERYAQELGQLNSAEIITRHFKEPNARHLLDKMMYTDLMTRLPEHTLMLTDRMTMAHGLEARSPLLDHLLVEYLAGFPPRLKIQRGTLKYILRQIAPDFLPQKIVRRDKQGFMFPVAYWFRNELRGLIPALLGNSYFVKEGIFNPEEINRLVDDHQNGRVDNHVRLWMLLNLELWQRLYLAGQTPDALSEILTPYVQQVKI